MTITNWMRDRRTTLISIVVGTISWVVAFGLGWKLWPSGPLLVPTADRLAYAAQLLAGVAVIVLLMIAACFRVFDTAASEDPFANAETPAWKVHQRVLQNTIEQSVVFAPSLLALATRVDPVDTKILPLLTTLWCAGRLLFWIGYRVSWKLRGPGFEWTLFSSVTALGWFASTL